MKLLGGWGVGLTLVLLSKFGSGSIGVMDFELLFSSDFLRYLHHTNTFSSVSTLPLLNLDKISKTRVFSKGLKIFQSNVREYLNGWLIGARDL